MTYEKELEDSLAAAIQSSMSGVAVYTEGDVKDEEELEQKALRNVGGAVFISYTGSKTFKKAGNASLYERNMVFAVTLLMPGRGSRGGLYDTLEAMRSVLYSFEYGNAAMRLIKESREKKTSEKGLYRGSMILEMHTVYPLN